MSSDYERVRRVIANELCIREDKIMPDTNLLLDLNPDSLDVVQIVHALEDEFGISINEDQEAFGTIAEIADLAGRLSAANKDLTPIL
jgi:acyl carrier protein